MRKHRAFWKSGRAASVLKYCDGLTQVGERMLYILAIVLKKLIKRNVLAVVGDGSDFAVLRHMIAQGRRGRGHLRYVADNQGFEPCRSEQPTHLRVKRLEVERHKYVSLTVANLVLENLFRIQRRVVDYRATGLHHAKESDDVVWRVGQVEPHMYAGAHTQFLKSLGRPIGKIAQSSIGDFLIHEIKGRVVRPPCG